MKNRIQRWSGLAGLAVNVRGVVVAGLLLAGWTAVELPWQLDCVIVVGALIGWAIAAVLEALS